MIFQHTWQQVLAGAKIETRRIWKQGYSLNRIGLINGNRVQYRINNTYAVQPGRGMASVGRIQICQLYKQDVTRITDDELWNEGYDSYIDFIQLWEQMHGNHYDALVIKFNLIAPATAPGGDEE